MNVYGTHDPVAASHTGVAPEQVCTSACPVWSELHTSRFCSAVGLHRYCPTAHAAGEHVGPDAGHSAALTHVASSGLD
jgi:hypothetical protein